jgi:hypothetical protein
MTRLRSTVTICLLLAGSLAARAQSNLQLAANLTPNPVINVPGTIQAEMISVDVPSNGEPATHVNLPALSTSSPLQARLLLASEENGVIAGNMPAQDGASSALVNTEKPAPVATGSRAADWKYFGWNAALFGSSVADVEALMRCTGCTAVPLSLQRRSLLYGIGLPIDAGIAYVGYLQKRNGRRWWFIPAAAVAVANAGLTYHWAHPAH